MTQYAIATDLNRCVGCLSCTVACKAVNGVDVGSFWIKTLRIGPNLKEGGSWPEDVEMYFLPVQCQHCEKPECVNVCPTGASQKLEDGTVQIDKSKCIGCQFCAMACPYNVRYLNEAEGVVEKCTLCAQRISQGDLPQCVTQCPARARFFGDLEQGLENFESGHLIGAGESPDYKTCAASRVKLKDEVNSYTDENVHRLTDVGNNPALLYILRDRTWYGEE